VNKGICRKQNEHGIGIISPDFSGIDKRQARIVKEENRCLIGFILGHGLRAAENFGLEPGHVFIEDLGGFPDPGFRAKEDGRGDLDRIDDSGDEGKFPDRLSICHFRG
jgi:hypothetical protein